MSNSALNGASWPIKISGKEFLAKTLTDRDYTEIDNYIQTKIIEIARNQLSMLLPSERSEFLQAAVKAAASSGWGTLEGAKIINNVEGALRLGWQMIKSNSRISFQAFCELARSQGQEALADNLSEIDIAFEKLNIVREEAENIVGESIEEGAEASSEQPKSE